MDFGALLTAAIPGLITAGSSYLSESNKPDYTQQQLDQNASQFAQTQALDREKLAQAMMIAQMNASAGNAGAGAAVTAARIKAATDEKAIKQQALQALLSGKLKQAELATGDTAVAAGSKVAEEARLRGQTGAQAFSDLVARMQAPLLARR